MVKLHYNILILLFLKIYVNQKAKSNIKMKILISVLPINAKSKLQWVIRETIYILWYTNYQNIMLNSYKIITIKTKEKH